MTTTKILKSWKNGNYYIDIHECGTKIRYVYENIDNLQPEFPESLDVKITDYCDLGCKYCHENSTIYGKHADIDVLINRLKDIPACEIAIGGGNPLSHPKLKELLIKLIKNNFIPSLTINEKSIGNNIGLLNDLVSENLINGLGISWMGGNQIYEYKNSVAHVIAGIHTFDDILKALKVYSKVLILGYKTYGRGILYKNINIDNNINYLKENLWKLMLNVHNIISFDNLAIEQLEVHKILKKEQWDKFYMGDDGKFTMYYDAVEDKFAQSSISKREDAEQYENATNYFRKLNYE